MQATVRLSRRATYDDYLAAERTSPLRHPPARRKPTGAIPV